MIFFKKKKYVEIKPKEATVFQDIDRQQASAELASFRAKEKARIGARQEQSDILRTAKQGYEREKEIERSKRADKIRGAVSKFSGILGGQPLKKPRISKGRSRKYKAPRRDVAAAFFGSGEIDFFGYEPKRRRSKERQPPDLLSGNFGRYF